MKTKTKKQLNKIGTCAFTVFNPVKGVSDDDLRLLHTKLDEEANLKEKETKQDDELLDFDDEVIK